jgi:transposase-like protein
MESVILSTSETPEVEVSLKPSRRTFTAKYKIDILEEAKEASRQRGAIGALLRREGLYSSHLIEWRKAAVRGELTALTPKKRGPKARVIDERDKKIAELQQVNTRLNKRIERAELMLEIQKKTAQLLGIGEPKTNDEGS